MNNINELLVHDIEKGGDIKTDLTKVLNVCEITEHIISLLDSNATKGVYTLAPICDGFFGKYIPHLVCKLFNIDKCNDINSDNYFKEFKEVESYLSKKCEDIFSDLISLHNNITLYFTLNENYGDYELQILVD